MISNDSELLVFTVPFPTSAGLPLGTCRRQVLLMPLLCKGQEAQYSCKITQTADASHLNPGLTLITQDHQKAQVFIL